MRYELLADGGRFALMPSLQEASAIAEHWENEGHTGVWVYDHKDQKFLMRRGDASSSDGITTTHYFRDRVEEDCDTAKLTVLNYSAGKQSTCLLWMVLRGEIETPENFIVLRADPGMENSETYRHAEMMREECAQAGIEYYVADGPNLYEDLVDLDGSETRLDNPPYWTKDEKGKIGKLRHKCTRNYKIAPMDRFIRKYLEEHFGISRKTSRLGDGAVEKWIGFSKDEAQRIKPPSRKYIRFRYPLIDLGMTTEDVIQFYEDRGLQRPPRSVCNACFANGLDVLEEMYHNRPDDWEQAVNVDEAVRDLSSIGVEDEVYVSHTGKPLEQIAEEGFTDAVDNKDEYSCDSGYCFV